MDVYPLQRTDGFHHASAVRLELWNSGDDLHLLERADKAAAGIPHHHRGFDGSHHHQITPRLDCMVHSWTLLSLG